MGRKLDWDWRQFQERWGGTLTRRTMACLSPVFSPPHPSRPQEFENPEGEDCSGEYTPPAEETSSSQSLPDVYILPLAEVSLPMPAPQPSHSGAAPCPAWDPMVLRVFPSGTGRLRPQAAKGKTAGGSPIIVTLEGVRGHLGGRHCLIQNHIWDPCVGPVVVRAAEVSISEAANGRLKSCHRILGCQREGRIGYWNLWAANEEAEVPSLECWGQPMEGETGACIESQSPGVGRCHWH